MTTLESLGKAEKLSLVEAMAMSPGWEILCQWIDSEIAHLDSQINTVDPKQNQVCYTEKDVHILEKQQLIALKQKPLNMIKESKDVNDGPTVDEVLNDIELMKPLPTAPEPTGLL